MSNYKFIVNPAYESYAGFVERLPFFFDTEGKVIYAERNTVKSFIVNGEQLVVKRYKRPMLHQRMDYTFIRKSKARRAYDYALRFLELGISTPTPVACVEEYKFGLFRTGYFVSTYCGDPDLTFLRDRTDEKMIMSFARFLVEIHMKGVLHGDLNLSNILYREDKTTDLGYRFTFIDINRSRFVSEASLHQCLRNMVRISHIRNLNEKIISCYAQQRGWDSDKCVSEVERMLTSFEARRKFKRRFRVKKR